MTGTTAHANDRPTACYVPSNGPADGPANQPTTSNPHIVHVQRSAPTPPTAVMFDNRYLIVRRLGEGGMGRVMLARDTFLYDREVAIKQMRADLRDDEMFRRRFAREQRILALAGVTHHVPALYGIGTDAAGSPYYVMEYVRGHTLHELMHLDGGTPTFRPEDVRRLMVEVFEGLSEIHRLGFVHRDVKPSNIGIDESGCVRLMDFGIARSFGTDGDAMTVVGQQVGSGQYASPEQRRCEPVDDRSDVYSAGVLMFELLTGRMPRSETSGGLHPPRLVQTPSDLVPGMPSWADELCRLALRPRASERPSAAQMMERLRMVQPDVRTAGGPVPAFSVPVRHLPSNAGAGAAMRFLGNLYFRGGRCVARDHAAAGRWYARAAANGDCRALYNLGVVDLASRHPAEAQAVFRAVAESPNADASLKACARARM
ncbi:serine/threonine-protein kinase [Bifidobacterium phasiani]|uniref:non-specific serine/threonine protein kinase n=1 Tax=Bifidobacterium phasiani TaxID=2834431 RepID=A0ABS6W804_9BIFI|nr:serine/threonine-protein kinase [Bifidobacterium phasiani]MBW3082631.1 protein kinase [Bifidobacterium phasiani]